MHWLVIYFYIQGSWIAGDFVRPDGWSSIAYDTKQQCVEKMYMANENLQKTEGLQDKAIVICQEYKPGPFTKTPKF